MDSKLRLLEKSAVSQTCSEISLWSFRRDPNDVSNCTALQDTEISKSKVRDLNMEHNENMKPHETCTRQQVQPLSNKIIDRKATQQRSGYTQTNTLMCVGFMMIRCLFILLKKVNLIKWQVSRPLKFFSAFQRWLTDLGNKKQSFYLHQRKACCFKVLRKNTFICNTMLLFILTHSVPEECRHVDSVMLSRHTVTCKHLNEPMAWVWGRTICFLRTNGKFIKHFFIWDGLFGTTKITVMWALIWHHRHQTWCNTSCARFEYVQAWIRI